ncbi:LVIVD repeat-containing protein [Nocardia cyriacigeorgica]|uniref:LVIVD repeat-containing protein n=1 Tax=Nocardia cyriacigeorgica TaxID=135487 RepID=UPI0013D4F53C|nr:hypothetical protein [Nocardia cyriacigeorgica]
MRKLSGRREGRRAAGLAVAAATVVLITPTGVAAGDPTAATPAVCGPGSSPETGIQGEVTQADRTSGRSAYSCNLRLVGRYAGNGSSWVSPSFESCAYMSAAWPSNTTGSAPGVHVVEVSDPVHPRLSTRLAEPAMESTWESLKVNKPRGLLAGVSSGPGLGAGYFSVYDIGTDCAHPRLLNTGAGSRIDVPIPVIGHEGEFSPDGRTYWASSAAGGVLTAIDITDPANPRVAWQGTVGIAASHGFSFSPDGNRMYLANTTPAGVTILDTSSVQRRDPLPAVTQVSNMNWTDGLATQHTIPVTVQGRPYLIVPDEAGSGGVKFIDIEDDRAPRRVGGVRLDINLPTNISKWLGTSMTNGIFSYDSHYCAVDRAADPTTLACSWFQSGVRVFDIRDMQHPREIAYYNPPGQADRRAQLTNSEHASGVLGAHVAPAMTGSLYVAQVLAGGNVDLSKIALNPPANPLQTDLTADWCSSPPEFHGDELWVTCQDNGFMVLKFENGVH